MRTSRIVAVGILALGLLGSALAQFSGPIPLAWRWSYSTAVAPFGAPVVANGVVYTAVGQRVFALDQATGNQKWRFPLVDPIPGYFRSAPVLAGDTIVAAGDNKLIYGVSADRGEPKWTYSTDVPIVGQPILVGNMIVFGLSDSTIMAINAETGAKAWNAPYKVFAGLTGQLAAYGNSVIFFSADNSLSSLNALTLKLNWNTRFTNVNTEAMPIIYGDYLYVNAGSYVSCLSAGGGRVRWQQNTGETLMYAPAVSGEGVLTVSRDGHAFLYESGGGRPKWREPLDLGSYPAVRPSAADKSFIQPTTAGSIVAIDPAKKEVIWSFLIKPQPGTTYGSDDTNNSGRGGRNGGPGAGSGGGSSLAGGGGGAAGAGQANQNTIPIAIPASGPAILVGKSLFVLAQDGSLLCFDPENGVDLTGPKVDMVWPNAGDQVSGQPPLQLIFTIDDEATGVNSSTIKIEIDGEEMEYEYGRDGVAVVRISTLTKNKPLMDGRRNIKITATDWMGNTTVKTYGLTVDNSLPPMAPPASAKPNQGRNGGPGAGSGGGSALGGGGL